MKIGDIVQNKFALRGSPHVKGSEIPRDTMGIVIDIRPDNLNNPPMMNYVDVVMSHGEEKAWCGNYAEGCFKVVI